VALQASVFVTIGLAWLFQGEKVSVVQCLGACVAASGLVVLVMFGGGDISIPGLALVLLAAVCWGAANLVGKSLGRVDMLSLVVWASAVAPVPLALLSWFVEGPQAIAKGLENLSSTSALAVAYIVYISTHLGYTGWAWLMARQPAAVVAPFTLLVPPLAGVFSAVVLGEEFPAWKIVAGSMVLSGVVINLMGPRVQALYLRSRAA
jgi:O-acetylserine/cysteine efflux transporter